MAGGEVDRPELDPPPRGRGATAATGGHRACQPVWVEEQPAQLREHLVERDGHPPILAEPRRTQPCASAPDSSAATSLPPTW